MFPIVEPVCLQKSTIMKGSLGPTRRPGTKAGSGTAGTVAPQGTAIFLNAVILFLPDAAASRKSILLAIEEGFEDKVELDFRAKGV